MGCSGCGGTVDAKRVKQCTQGLEKEMMVGDAFPRGSNGSQILKYQLPQNTYFKQLPPNITKQLDLLSDPNRRGVTVGVWWSDIYTLLFSGQMQAPLGGSEARLGGTHQ